ncbi:DUF4397 domain-containing protein [Pedobacter chinensis]|uniref:DUF4397 domain-containing protein n=1 Tax=Pedobacter chinensis TaxID=2282421 RepID=A0A369PQ63_9SPHI|nr:DUF4397 domain-containing protein [Pedobacter chinensis]RDC54791.1 DUF4397 domain-containing protein [Pedobacter chinensis]
MKNFTPILFKNSKFFPVILLFISVTFFACKKEESDTTLSQLRVINTAPTLATYYAFVNGSSISSAALPYGGTTAYGNYSSGSYAIKFTSENNAESLLTKNITLNPNSYHSFYLINKPEALDGLTITDDLSLPSTDKAYIRYINLSPDAPALDLAKTGEATALIGNKTYKSASAFIAIAPGTYTFDVKETSSGTVKAVSNSITLAAGYHYDIICGGLLNPSSDIERPLNLIAVTIK